jgi:hypothetical protein
MDLLSIALCVVLVLAVLCIMMPSMQWLWVGCYNAFLSGQLLVSFICTIGLGLGTCWTLLSAFGAIFTLPRCFVCVAMGVVLVDLYKASRQQPDDAAPLSPLCVYVIDCPAGNATLTEAWFSLCKAVSACLAVLSCGGKNGKLQRFLYLVWLWLAMPEWHARDIMLFVSNLIFASCMIDEHSTFNDNKKAVNSGAWSKTIVAFVCKAISYVPFGPGYLAAILFPEIIIFCLGGLFFETWAKQSAKFSALWTFLFKLDLGPTGPFVVVAFVYAYLQAK